jgi:23S rRNA (guanosine2251-2'-O)-methyltransferase
LTVRQRNITLTPEFIFGLIIVAQSNSESSSNYARKKAFFAGMLTIYGRKPVLEALTDTTIPVHCLHLAESNKAGGIIRELEALAEQRNVPIKHHTKLELSRISKNSREDQGVAADLRLPGYQRLDDFIDGLTQSSRTKIIALDRITNPQNLGMLIRSACAGGIDAVLLPEKGCAPLSPLVIKSSAGTLFKCPIVRCGDLYEALMTLREKNFSIAALSSHAKDALFDLPKNVARAYVLGNESDGVSPEIMQLADLKIRIPMANGVESLNVAVTAALLAYCG